MPTYKVPLELEVKVTNKTELREEYGDPTDPDDTDIMVHVESAIDIAIENMEVDGCDVSGTCSLRTITEIP